MSISKECFLCGASESFKWINLTKNGQVVLTLCLACAEKQAQREKELINADRLRD